MNLDDVIELAESLADHVEDILLSSNTEKKSFLFNPQTYLSEEKLFEVAQYALRDLSRLEEDQNGRVATSKFVCYIAFWFAKLKPLNSIYVVQTGSTEFEDEIKDINEEVSTILMSRLLVEMVYLDGSLAPDVWKSCDKEHCKYTVNGSSVMGNCFVLKASKYLSDFEGKYKNYIIYGLRYRSISPYFLVNYLDQAIYFSCEVSFQDVNLAEIV